MYGIKYLNNILFFLVICVEYEGSDILENYIIFWCFYYMFILKMDILRFKKLMYISKYWKIKVCNLKGNKYDSFFNILIILKLILICCFVLCLFIKVVLVVCKIFVLFC